MIQKTKGIVLHSIKYGDTSLIAHLYTEDFGRHSFLFKGVRSNKSKIKSNIIQPIFILNLESYFKEGKDLSLVKEASLTKPFTHIPYELHKSAQAMFIAEILYHCLREEELNKPLFEFICSSIEYFDLMTSGSADFHIIFLVKLSKYLGFYPASRETENDFVSDIKPGIYKDHIPTHFDYINHSNSALLDKILNANYENLIDLDLNHKKRNDLLEAILKFYSFHIEEITRLKSFLILRGLFN